MTGVILCVGAIVAFLATNTKGRHVGLWEPFAVYTENDAFTSLANCSSNSDCLDIDPFGTCVVINVTDHVGGGTHHESRCVCDQDHGYYRYTTSTQKDSCKYHSAVGESCLDIRSICVTENTVCKTDGDNVGKDRCLCKPGYVEVSDDNDTTACATIIHKDIHVQCATCEANGGTCYDTNLDKLMDGCACPASRSGAECSRIHVNVSCEIDTFTMIVCYEPHDGFNFSAGALVVVDGFANDDACIGHLVGEGDLHCAAGTYKLWLPLQDHERVRCNTFMFMSDIHMKKFENKIVVQKMFDGVTQNDIVFKTFCAFQTYQETAFYPVRLFVLNKNDRGQHHFPDLSFSVENQLGEPVAEGVSLRLGDKIRFTLRLTVDGAYSALRVERCSASTSPTMPDPKAFTLPLIVASCPREIFTEKTNWRQISEQMNELTTGYVSMFKLPSGHSVHFHCFIKLCLLGSEDECLPMNCTSPANHMGYGKRKRRAAISAISGISGSQSMAQTQTQQPGSEGVMVSRELVWTDEEETPTEKPDIKEHINSQAGQQPAMAAEDMLEDTATEEEDSAMSGTMIYWILIGVIGVLLLLFMALAFFLYVKLRKRTEEQPMEQAQGGNFTNAMPMGHMASNQPKPQYPHNPNSSNYPAPSNYPGYSNYPNSQNYSNYGSSYPSNNHSPRNSTYQSSYPNYYNYPSGYSSTRNQSHYMHT